ncbi:MAG: hypothetical protein ACOX6H_03830 [Christensenellales bacterium]|jgi:hypothetical protein
MKTKKIKTKEYIYKGTLNENNMPDGFGKIVSSPISHIVTHLRFNYNSLKM